MSPDEGTALPAVFRCSRCGRMVHAATYRWAPGDMEPGMVCDACRARADADQAEALPWPSISLVCTCCGRAPFPGAAEVWTVRPDLGRCWCPHCHAAAAQRGEAKP